MKLSEFAELQEMKKDFEKIGCLLRLYGSMKKHGHSEHDIDFVLRIYNKRYQCAMFSKLKKWNRRIIEKYKINLDVLIQNQKKKHIFDFESRYGLMKPEKFEAYKRS